MIRILNCIYRVTEGPPTVPFFGNALLAIGLEPRAVVEKLLEYESYGKVVRAFLGPKLYVFILDPRDIEIILSSHVHIDKSVDYRYFTIPNVPVESLILELFFQVFQTVVRRGSADKHRREMEITQKAHSPDLPSEYPEIVRSTFLREQ